MHGIRLNIGRDWKKPAAVALCAFVGCQVAASAVISWADIRREGFMDVVLAGLPEHPRLLIVGSSHSARGLDGDMLQAELHMPVAQLTRAGAFAFEQDLALDRYLAHASPPLVLIELGSEFYVQGDRQLFAPYNIEFADIRRTWWGVRLVIERPDRPFAEQLEAVCDRLRHMLAHLTHAGIVRHARHDRPWPAKGFQPSSVRPADLTDADIARSLAASDGPSMDLTAALTFRRWQKEKVLATGVSEVRFFVPPIADPERRGWADGLCAALGSDCMPMDPDFLRSLPPEMWADRVHLRPEAVPLYTHWFAQRIDALQ